MVLEVPGGEATSSDGLLAGRVLRCAALPW